MRYSDSELLFLNNMFAEGYDLLVLIRKFLLQGEMTEHEKKLFEGFNPDLIKILRKTYLPEIDLNCPIGQIVDLWSNIDTKNKDVESTAPDMESRKILVDYLKERFDALTENRFDSKIKFDELGYSENKSKYQNFIDLSARNSLIQHIDFQTGQLWILSGQRKESLHEIQKRLFRDSSK